MPQNAETPSNEKSPDSDVLRGWKEYWSNVPQADELQAALTQPHESAFEEAGNPVPIRMIAAPEPPAPENPAERRAAEAESRLNELGRRNAEIETKLEASHRALRQGTDFKGSAAQEESAAHKAKLANNDAEIRQLKDERTRLTETAAGESAAPAQSEAASPDAPETNPPEKTVSVEEIAALRQEIENLQRREADNEDHIAELERKLAEASIIPATLVVTGTEVEAQPAAPEAASRAIATIKPRRETFVGHAFKRLGFGSGFRYSAQNTPGNEPTLAIPPQGALPEPAQEAPAAAESREGIETGANVAWTEGERPLTQGDMIGGAQRVETADQERAGLSARGRRAVESRKRSAENDFKPFENRRDRLRAAGRRGGLALAFVAGLIAALTLASSTIEEPKADAEAGAVLEKDKKINELAKGQPQENDQQMRATEIPPAPPAPPPPPQEQLTPVFSSEMVGAASPGHHNYWDMIRSQLNATGLTHSEKNIMTRAQVDRWVWHILSHFYNNDGPVDDALSDKLKIKVGQIVDFSFLNKPENLKKVYEFGEEVLDPSKKFEHQQEVLKAGATFDQDPQ